MYHAAFQVSILLTVLSHVATSGLPLSIPRLFSRKAALADPNASFRLFQANYLLVYLLAVAADWLQGPYVYALYSYYGYKKSNIARLYIAGFASSAIFGTFVASIADKYGRRNNALLYCLTYTLSCVTKHYPNYYVLFLGRVLGGVAYSILFSAFEAWMVYEHHHHAFDSSSLAATFARAQFGNGIVAIASGQLAGWLARRYGKVSPFDLSILVLVILSIVISATWRENYGDSSQSLKGGFSRAFVTLISDRKILLLGIAQAAFEGAMYTFTFVWTPALQKAGGQSGEIPHGTIFSTFMACTMIGSNVFAVASRHFRAEVIMRLVFAIGAVLFVMATWLQVAEVTYGVFLIFEVLCGVYFPGMATTRAPYIPEESRSALLTFFRIPLNVIVVVALYEDMEVRSVFALCAALMAIATVSQHYFIGLAQCGGSADQIGDGEISGKEKDEVC